MLISKTEVPAFIPRDDMADQIVRWAIIESSDNAISKFGMPFKVSGTRSCYPLPTRHTQVEEVFRPDDGRLWGANLLFLRNGETVTTLYIGTQMSMTL